MMTNYICETCGVQYTGMSHHPDSCDICTEERQYVSPDGQSWTTLEEMKEKGYENVLQDEEEGLYSIKTSPEFGIGQTAYLVQRDGFNVLWDCITFLDEATVRKIEALGGIDAIALSHPHYYSTQVEWAETFNVPVYIHEDDREWVMRQSGQIVFWSGESLVLAPGITLYRLGGHFKGGAVLEWRTGNEDKGILLTGDVIQVVADRNWVSFMYSYPNLIPLPAASVEKIAAKTKELKFDRLYNAFHRVVKEDAHGAVQRSAKRYVDALSGKVI
ncbi:MBL fold metallo-hydrolase [Sutcliffiella sp. NPDC057660]|uniref:MBL fold metallo-hydrolase n=1 Tax=Sutcliffiella sp. NPDC057660 TaxID=3346199 RepID=UPI00367789EF